MVYPKPFGRPHVALTVLLYVVVIGSLLSIGELGLSHVLQQQVGLIQSPLSSCARFRTVPPIGGIPHTVSIPVQYISVWSCRRSNEWPHRHWFTGYSSLQCTTVVVSRSHPFDWAYCGFTHLCLDLQASELYTGSYVWANHMFASSRDYATVQHNISALVPIVQ